MLDYITIAKDINRSLPQACLLNVKNKRGYTGKMIWEDHVIVKKNKKKGVSSLGLCFSLGMGCWEK